MHASGEAGLWRPPELDNALAWKRREDPSPEWASRYAGDFASVTQFLNRSQEARTAEEAEKESRRNEELRRARRHLVVVSAFSVVALLLAAYGWVETVSARRNGEAARFNAEKAGIAAAEAMKHAEEAHESASRVRLGALRERKFDWGSVSNELYLLNEFIKVLPPRKASEWRLQRAQLLIRQDRLDDALTDLDAVVEAAPDSRSARTSRGYASFLNNRADKALEDFKYIQEHIDSRDPLNSLNFSITLAALGRYDEARQSLEKAIRDAPDADNTGGEEDQIPPDVTDATGRLRLQASGDAFLAALYYHIVNFDAYAGGDDFLRDLKAADQKASTLKRLSDREEAYFVSLTWAWLQQRVRPQDYGVLASEGALWERARFPDYAARYYAQFQEKHAARADPRYRALASWVTARQAALAAAGSPVHVSPHVMEAEELELESQIQETRKEFESANDSITKAIQIEPTSIDLYFQQFSVLFSMAKEAADAAKKAEEEADAKRTMLNKPQTASVAPPITGKGDANASIAGQKGAVGVAAIEERPDRQHSAKELRARSEHLYDQIVQDCTKVLNGRPGAAEAYFDRAMATDWKQKPDRPLRQNDHILEDLRHGLALRQDNEMMDYLVDLLTGDVSAMAPNDPRLKEALAWRLRYSRISPEDAGNFAHLAALQSKNGRFEDAAESIQSAIAIDPGVREYYDIRADVETGLGIDAVNVRRHQADGHRQAEEASSRLGNSGTGSAYWTLMSDVARTGENTELVCNAAVTTCTESRTFTVSADWVFGRIDSVEPGHGGTRMVRIDRGRRDGVVVGSHGFLYAQPSTEGTHERQGVQIGSGDVLSVTGDSALVRVVLKSPTGDGAVRPNDDFRLRAVVPSGAQQSTLWKLATYHVALQDLTGRTIVDYRTLYDRATAPSDEKLMAAMLDDIHGAVASESIMNQRIETGRFAGKTIAATVQETTRADLERFLKFVEKYPRDFFGRDWKVTELYVLWAREGSPE
jgi:tetratricopeptide (TPR) repeat protein